MFEQCVLYFQNWGAIYSTYISRKVIEKDTLYTQLSGKSLSNSPWQNYMGPFWTWKDIRGKLTIFFFWATYFRNSAEMGGGGEGEGRKEKTQPHIYTPKNQRLP